MGNEPLYRGQEILGQASEPRVVKVGGRYVQESAIRSSAGLSPTVKVEKVEEGKVTYSMPTEQTTQEQREIKITEPIIPSKERLEIEKQKLLHPQPQGIYGQIIKKKYEEAQQPYLKEEYLKQEINKMTSPFGVERYEGDVYGKIVEQQIKEKQKERELERELYGENIQISIGDHRKFIVPTAEVNKALSPYIQKAIKPVEKEAFELHPDIKEKYPKLYDTYSKAGEFFYGAENIVRSELRYRPSTYMLDFAAGAGIGASMKILKILPLYTKSKKALILTKNLEKYGKAALFTGGTIYAGMKGTELYLAPSYKKKGEVAGKTLLETASFIAGAKTGTKAVDVAQGLLPTEIKLKSLNLLNSQEFMEIQPPYEITFEKTPTTLYKDIDIYHQLMIAGGRKPIGFLQEFEGIFKGAKYKSVRTTIGKTSYDIAQIGSVTSVSKITPDMTYVRASIDYGFTFKDLFGRQKIKIKDGEIKAPRIGKEFVSYKFKTQPSLSLKQTDKWDIYSEKEKILAEPDTIDISTIKWEQIRGKQLEGFSEKELPLFRRKHETLDVVKAIKGIGRMGATQKEIFFKEYVGKKPTSLYSKYITPKFVKYYPKLRPDVLYIKQIGDVTKLGKIIESKSKGFSKLMPELRADYIYEEFFEFPEIKFPKFKGKKAGLRLEKPSFSISSIGKKRLDPTEIKIGLDSNIKLSDLFKFDFRGFDVRTIPSIKPKFYFKPQLGLDSKQFSEIMSKTRARTKLDSKQVSEIMPKTRARTKLDSKTTQRMVPKIKPFRRLEPKLGIPKYPPWKLEPKLKTPEIPPIYPYLFFPPFKTKRRRKPRKPKTKKIYKKKKKFFEFLPYSDPISLYQTERRLRRRATQPEITKKEMKEYSKYLKGIKLRSPTIEKRRRLL